MILKNTFTIVFFYSLSFRISTECLYIRLEKLLSLGGWMDVKKHLHNVDLTNLCWCVCVAFCFCEVQLGLGCTSIAKTGQEGTHLRIPCLRECQKIPQTWLELLSSHIWEVFSGAGTLQNKGSKGNISPYFTLASPHHLQLQILEVISKVLAWATAWATARILLCLPVILAFSYSFSD